MSDKTFIGFKAIDSELNNIRATLHNALEIAESGDVP